MNSRAHQIAQQGEYLPMAGDRAFSDKRGRNQYQAVVSALARTGVAGVQRAVVVNLEGMNVEFFGQDFPDTGNGFGAHGRVFLKGRTVVRTKTP